MLICRINTRTTEKAGMIPGLLYTNALLQGFFHHVRRLIPHARQHVGVGIQGDGYRGVPEELLNDLGVHALAEKERGARVTEVVEAGPPRQTGPLEEPEEGTAGQRPGAHGLARLAREDETVILPQRAEAQPLSILGGLVALEDLDGPGGQLDAAALAVL